MTQEQKQAYLNRRIEEARESDSSYEPFDTLFDRWAEEAVSAAGFPAEKPSHAARIPTLVRKKVAASWEMGLCVADAQPACFRMADRSGKTGGPYKWFSYREASRTVAPNWEYFVQVAAFHDLVVEHHFPPGWMKFEYHETHGSFCLSLDIGIVSPQGRKLFIEVKESKDQWESLIAAVIELGRNGVDLNAPDRGDDPLRKAKSIVAGKPEMFVGYTPGGFHAYRVQLDSETHFTLNPAAISDARSLNEKTPGKTVKSDSSAAFLIQMLDFIEERFEEPSQTIWYLQSRRRCLEEKCRQTDCASLLPRLRRPIPWDSLPEIISWCQGWYASARYEEPVNALFTLPMVAEFLTQQGYGEGQITHSFKMEFKGGGNLGHNVPPCLWRGQQGETVKIPKDFRGEKGMCCDFCLLPPFPTAVAEVKVAMPETASGVMKTFPDDLEKCEEWLKSDTAPFVKAKFGIERFDYALAILIDLTGGSEYRRWWNANINEEVYRERGIFVRLIAPRASSRQTAMRVSRQDVTFNRSDQTPQSKAREISPPRPTSPETPAFENRENLDSRNSLDIALEAALRCERTGQQQGVEVRLTSWEAVHDFKLRVESHLRRHNLTSSTPIRHAAPWAWRIRSGGHPRTANGREFGVELRFSFNKAGNKL